ncbi:unnamed protein product [Adineta steineri]|uniref:Uncharacterized protein n=1 Tax=Adineta steineri TaxID=433720 RepID=A0A818VZ55_9BILA|nr:unnamed protein product [Adineta steineri]CAF3718304.1 unnamed protein product [Adineta steineri]
MVNNLVLFVIISLLWHVCSSTHECNRTIDGSIMTFTCPSNVSNQMLRLYDLTTTQLSAITAFIAQGVNDTAKGPFTSIPPNICLLPNLQIVIFSNNQIVTVDPTAALTTCFSNVNTLDLSDNYISQFPSYLIYNMQNLQNLYFQDNQLIEVPSYAFYNVSSLNIIDFSYNNLTTFDLWALDVKTSADFSHNQITTITNKYLYIPENTFNTSNTTDRTYARIFLTGNGPTINLTDAIYEMYDECDEASTWLSSTNGVLPAPTFTNAIANIDFGTTQINCSCDQAYIRFFFGNPLPLTGLPIANASCSPIVIRQGKEDVSISVSFLNYSCSSAPASSVDFTKVYPRFCQITETDEGALTTIGDTTIPTSNVSTYPHYVTVNMNPGSCFFTFFNTTTMNITCTNDTSNTLSTIPATLLTSDYMSNITKVMFYPTISILPTYLCSLPSGDIDLSYESFTTLNDATFPCLDSFQTVSLSHNQITSVNMANGDFKNLTSLDLSYNNLTQIPYSVLTPTPTSLRYLDLEHNSINYIDLFVSTRKNITIDLNNNPIVDTNILNPQNTTLGNYTNSTAIVIYPSNVTNGTIIISDATALTYGFCNDFTALRNYLLSFESISNNVLVDCTCNSYNLRNSYQNNSLNITQDFNCANGTNSSTFYSLTTANCSTRANFSSGLCATQTTLDITTMQTSITSVTNSMTTSSSVNGTGGTSTVSQITGVTLSTNTGSSNSSSNNTSSTTIATTSNTTSSSTNSTTSNTTSSNTNSTTSNNTSSTTISTTSNTTSSNTNSTTSNTTSSNTNSTTNSNTTSSNTNSTTSNTTTISTTVATSGNSNDNVAVQSSDGSDSRRTGLIVGLVVGIIGFFILLALLIFLFWLLKKRHKNRGGRGKKPVRRADITGKPGDTGTGKSASLTNRVQPRNFRPVKLAPLTGQPSQLPLGPVGTVVPTGNNLNTSQSNSTLRQSKRGIPLRLEPTKPATSVAPPIHNSPHTTLNLHPDNNTSMNQPPIPQQHHAPIPQQQQHAPIPQQHHPPIVHQQQHPPLEATRSIPPRMLNIGADVHH